MTVDGFRRLALSLPEASESAHMGHPDFRVRGKIFATIGWPDRGWAMVKLTPEQQAAFVAEAPEIFLPIPGGFGKMGHTHIRLAKASEGVLQGALRAAWQARREMNAKVDGKARAVKRRRML